MQLLINLIKEFAFSYVLFIFSSKYAYVVPLKNKKGITITNAFQKILDEWNCKPNKIWVDQGSEFYSRSTKSWFQDNDTEMYSTHSEGNSAVAERFIKTVKNKI